MACNQLLVDRFQVLMRGNICATTHILCEQLIVVVRPNELELLRRSPDPASLSRKSSQLMEELEMKRLAREAEMALLAEEVRRLLRNKDDNGDGFVVVCVLIVVFIVVRHKAAPR